MNDDEKSLDNLMNNLEVCPNCKAVVNGERYCHNCGKDLLRAKIFEQNQETPPPPEPEKQTSPVVTVLIIVLIAAVVGLCWYIYNDNKTDSEERKRAYQEMRETQESSIYFNCPYCLKYISIPESKYNKAVGDTFSYRCDHCNKLLKINLKTHEVK